mmetsp:Transcript_23844/g.60682  ORF Transcript_23844/g.60682 Transcript_23844/m.60682 type:complete len:142 (-) Transcript_23844:188-613(-)
MPPVPPAAPPAALAPARPPAVAAAAAAPEGKGEGDDVAPWKLGRRRRMGWDKEPEAGGGGGGDDGATVVSKSSMPGAAPLQAANGTMGGDLTKATFAKASMQPPAGPVPVGVIPGSAPMLGVSKAGMGGGPPPPPPMPMYR